MEPSDLDTLAPEEITETHEHLFGSLTVARAAEMEGLNPIERYRRIMKAGDKVIDMREVFRREKASR